MSGAKKSKENKSAIIFTLDALFAGLIVVIALIALSQNFIEEDKTPDLTYLSYDLVKSFSSIKTYELNNSYLKELIANGVVNNTNNTILETIGELYVLNKSVEAQKLAENISNQLIPKRYGFSIAVNDEVVYTNSKSVEKSVMTAKRLISGIEKFKPVRGSTSKVYLQGIKEKKTFTYYYFGGFIGQGNISVFTEGTPADAGFTSLFLKAELGGNFSFYVNNNFCADLNQSYNQLVTVEYDLEDCMTFLVSGRNNFTLASKSNLIDSYIAGGYIKMGYTTSELSFAKNNYALRYYLPGINGIINTYDSVYTPGTVNSIILHAHFNSTQYTYLDIAGSKVFELNANGTETSFDLADASLKQVLPSYDLLSNTTIPIRMASYNLTETLSNITTADVVIITDFSGSMKKNFDTTGQGNNQYDCPNILEDYDVRRYRHAQCLDEEFLNIIFGNVTGGKVWPVHIHDDAIESYTQDPTNYGLVRNYVLSVNSGNGKTCLPCALNSAYNIFKANNQTNRTRYIIFMTDGVPTHTPVGGIYSNSTIYGTEVCDGFCDVTGSCSGDPSSYEGCALTDHSCDDSFESTKYALNRSVTDFNATMYAIGFGDIMSKCPNAAALLSELASMSVNGTFNVSNNLQELQDIYEEIAYDILLTTDQIAQLVNVSSNFTTGTLYGDSYIEFNLTPATKPAGFGEIEVLIEEPVNNCDTTINIPSQIRVIESIATSYSGIHWTNNLSTNGKKSFSLKDFGIRYWEIGDPFRIYIPTGQVNTTTSLRYVLADSPTNISSNCSKNNSFVYIGGITSQVSYSDVLEKMDGCNWTVEYEDNNLGHFLVPPEYNGEKTCNYTSTTWDLKQYDLNDTYDDATYRLFRNLDFDDDGRIFVNLEEQDLVVDAIAIQKVPYPWGPAIAEVRVWQ